MSVKRQRAGNGQIADDRKAEVQLRGNHEPPFRALFPADENQEIDDYKLGGLSQTNCGHLSDLLLGNKIDRPSREKGHGKALVLCKDEPKRFNSVSVGYPLVFFKFYQFDLVRCQHSHRQKDKVA